MIDYARPIILAENHLKALHHAMLNNKPEQAIDEALKAIVEIRLAIASIKCVNQQ